MLSRTIAGSGPGLLLTHGWPHDRHLWSRVVDELGRRFTVVVPDLPGIGSSTASDAFDAAAMADALDACCAEVGPYAVMSIDASVPAGFLLAATERATRAVLMEGTLPGAQGFPSPWWFGFHAVPGFAERVLAGHEAAYLDFFLDAGTVRPLEPAVRQTFHAAHAGERFAHGLGWYRAMPTSAEQLVGVRATVPVLAVGARPVAGVLADQLTARCDDLTSVQLPDCGHLIPLDAPDALLAAAVPFLLGRDGVA